MVNSWAVRPRWLGVAVAVAALVVSACTPAVPPIAYPVGSVPTTGALYFAGASSHECTASVVSSSTQNLVITAAHCIHGTGRGMTFVPGSVNGSEPYGSWTVVAAYADPGWTIGHDQLRDVAILKVAPDRIFGTLLQLQQVIAGNRLVVTPATIGAVQVPAYAVGAGGQPFSCLATAYHAGPYTGFDCRGYGAGGSGAPFIQGSNVLGVLGGLHQGGCLSSTSYAAPFDATTLALLRRAASGAVGDSLPGLLPDGC